MNEQNIQELLDYQLKIINKNQQIQKFFKTTSPFSKRGGFLYSSHQKMFNALGGQIGMAKAIIKLLNQRTFEFEDLQNEQKGNSEIKKDRVFEG